MTADYKIRATLDQSIGIPSKDTFYQYAQRLLDENPTTEYDFIVSDIDRFRVINDLHGYEKGDELLRYSEQKAKEYCLAIGGICGHYFADIMMSIVPRQEGLIEYILDTASRNLEKGPIKPAPSVKFGVYHIDDRGLPISAMCDRSMLALASLRENKVIKYAFYEEEHREQIIKEDQVIGRIDAALSNGDLDIYMQPKYNLKSRRISGAETLVRWTNSTKGSLSPDEFIPILEKNGIVFKVDFFVWEQACKVIRHWIDNNMPIVPISVNFSRVDLDIPELESIFMGMIQKYQVPAEYFIFEITETVYSDLDQSHIAFIEKLRSRGFRVEMDDFGSGSSSLNMLKDIFVDNLKIDLNFLSGIGDNSRGEKILRLVIDLAADLDLGVVVEGVEESYQADFLQDIGCETAQGYYFAHPMPVKEFEKALAKDHEKAHERWKRIL